jgi:hypothetical protein
MSTITSPANVSECGAALQRLDTDCLELRRILEGLARYLPGGTYPGVPADPKVLAALTPEILVQLEADLRASADRVENEIARLGPLLWERQPDLKPKATWA